MSKTSNSCPNCGLKRSPASTLCPQCDKATFIDKCKAGYDAIDTMPNGKHFRATVLFLFLNMLLPGIIIAISTMNAQADLANTLVNSSMGVWSLIIGQFAVLIAFLLLCRKYLTGVFAKCMNVKAVLAACVLGGIVIVIGFCWDWVKNIIQIAVNKNTEASILLVKNFPAASFINMVIGAALAEEITFRVGVFGFVRRKSRILAYIVSAVLFGLVHVDLTGASVQELLSMPIYIIIGLICAYAYEKYGLLANVIVHAMNNLIAWVQIIIA